MNTVNENRNKIKKFLRTIIEWYIAGSITENNLKYKIDDCKKSYPDFDYETEYGLITGELKIKLEVIRGN